MNTRKNLQASIARMEARVRNEQAAISEHRQYFNQFYHDHSLVLIALLLPSFLSGWQLGKVLPTRNLLKQVTKFALMTLFTSIRSKNQ